jgi:hypothetical protein
VSVALEGASQKTDGNRHWEWREFCIGSGGEGLASASSIISRWYCHSLGQQVLTNWMLNWDQRIQSLTLSVLGRQARVGPRGVSEVQHENPEPEGNQSKVGKGAPWAGRWEVNGAQQHLQEFSWGLLL